MNNAMILKGTRKRIKTEDAIFHTFNYAFWIIFTFICVYPFYYILINSISNNKLVQAGQIKIWPQDIHFQNYIDLLSQKSIYEAAGWSIMRVVIGVIITVSSTAFLGYCMTRNEYWHRKFWYRFMIITMYVGAPMIPRYMMYRAFGVLDTFWIYILGNFCATYNMVLVKTYIEGIPDSLEEAAIVDGAGYGARFFKVILPLCKPVLATIAIFTAVGEWNAYMDTVIYMPTRNCATLQYVMYVYMNKANQLAEMIAKSDPERMAELSSVISPVAVRQTITAITVLPILMVYPFFQKYFTKGIMVGAIKG